MTSRIWVKSCDKLSFLAACTICFFPNWSGSFAIACTPPYLPEAVIIRHTSLANPQHPGLNIFTGPIAEEHFPIQVFEFNIGADSIFMM